MITFRAHAGEVVHIAKLIAQREEVGPGANFSIFPCLELVRSPRDGYQAEVVQGDLTPRS